ncbi:MAG: glycoside hydrolase family 2 TIM barrel-domain containing protein [Gemmatimonadales bacterium]
MILPESLLAQAEEVPRLRMSIDSGWKFYPNGLNLAEKPAMPDSNWQKVSLPHTWNASDPFDDLPSYRRGIGWYRKWVSLRGFLAHKKVFLNFEGVNQIADVYVNGAFVGQHKGGYTAFTIDITKQLKFDGKANDNLIAVQVDNSHDPFIPPLSVGYALYGGIYRDAWIVSTDSLHEDMTDHGSSGVFVSTPSVTNTSATASIRGTVVNETGSTKTVRVVNTLSDARGTQVANRTTDLQVGAGQKVSWSVSLPAIANPHLWSPGEPYLYSMRTEIYAGSILRDRLETPVGFRWFRFDAQTGFWLNGKKLQLRGTNRHQDYRGLGSALSDSFHVRDMKWIKDMGANFVRLAHYPQALAVLAAADRLGLLIWEEVPVVNYITPDPQFTANAENMLREMIRQNFNHPSVITWGIMNEVFLWSPEGFRIRKQVDTAYTSQVLAFAKHMDSVAKAADPSRPVTMAVHGSDDYDVAGLTRVTDILGQNIYSGWYSGVFDDFGRQLDRRHAAHPNENIFVSEYGAEDDFRVNSLEPERFDFSGTWMKRYHESYVRQLTARPWLAGTAVWNQFDFSQPETGGSIPYMNQKGLQMWDRTPKDVYYLYKANWNPAPMVRVASRGWARRTGIATPQPVDVYSNLSSVELIVNGRSLGTRSPDDVHRATWDVTFSNGKNALTARGKTGSTTIADSMVIDFVQRPAKLADAAIPFREIGVNTGGHLQYAQPGGIVWEGDQKYVAGSFGYLDGELKIFDKDLAIKESKDTPLYFTYLSGVTSYRFDVPDADYTVEFLFAEPEAKAGERVFSVSLNGKDVIADVDLSAKYGIARAATIDTSVSAKNGEGINVGFRASKGKAILNAIRVRKK